MTLGVPGSNFSICFILCHCQTLLIGLEQLCRQRRMSMWCQFGDGVLCRPEDPVSSRTGYQVSTDSPVVVKLPASPADSKLPTGWMDGCRPLRPCRLLCQRTTLSRTWLTNFHAPSGDELSRRHKGMMPGPTKHSLSSHGDIKLVAHCLFVLCENTPFLVHSRDPLHGGEAGCSLP